jgi:hypothetical protein
MIELVYRQYLLGMVSPEVVLNVTDMSLVNLGFGIDDLANI